MKGVLIDGVTYDDLFELEGVDVVTAKPFKARTRNRPVTRAVIHESETLDADVATDMDTTERILRRKGYGVHVMCDAGDGQLVQHNDLSKDTVIHASGFNVNSIGIEVVTPYYGHLLKPGMPWTRVIDAPWAHKKKYVVPTIEQLSTLVRFLQAITEVQAGNVYVPRLWPGMHETRVCAEDNLTLTKRTMAMSRIDGLTKQDIRTVPGIWAHAYTEHADGCFPVLFCWLVMEHGCSHADAYELAIELASGARQTVPLPD